MSTSASVSPASGAPSSSAANTNANTPTRLKFHDQSSAAARNSIISSSAKGWSPLQINKRDSISSPLKTSTLPSSPDGNGSGPRRTSSSFRHMATNSLVARSPFKDPSTLQGSQAIGKGSDDSPKVIHERRTAASSTTTPTRTGQGTSPAKGAPSTPKAAIGLGITATRPRSSSDKNQDKGSAVAGTRRVSSERKIAFPGSSSERKTSGERRVSGERKVSGSKENESPDVRAGKRTPRNSSSFKGLAKNELVSRSPFLAGSGSVFGGLSASSSFRANESPANPSPKTVPVPREVDDTSATADFLASPSPRRISGGSLNRRRVSPSASLASARTSHSPTPSPPRLFAHQPGLTSAGPSPLSQETSTALEIPSIATPTPTKSSFSASRRLHGPRGVASTQDSPTKQSKTVTFHSIPDVKEFERMSVEGSADGSFEVDQDIDNDDTDTDAEEWVDDHQVHHGENLDDLVRSTHRQLTFTNPDSNNGISPSLTDGFPTPHESATADFVSTLIEEGLFSPPQLGTPTFADQPDFQLPLEPEIGADDLGHGDSDNGIANGSGWGCGDGGGAAETPLSGETGASAAFLSTPSLGGSVHATPLMEAIDNLPSSMDISSSGSSHLPERDEVGIPYGRTHHSERAALAHTLPPVSRISPLEQPHLPHSDDHTMLFNGNAAKPSIQQPSTNTSTLKSISPPVHQSGPLQDPFITIETITKVLSPEKDSKGREEDGVPLGRTSHVERVNAARALASRSIGLGLPGMHRSPAVLKNLSCQDRDPHGQDQGQNMERRDSDDTPGRKIVFSPNILDSSTLFSKGKESAQNGVEEGSDVFGAVINTPRKVSEVPELVGPSKRMTQFKKDKETPKKEMKAQPPAPMPLDLPEPIAASTRSEPAPQSNRSSVLMKAPFSLPFIGTSPLFSAEPTFQAPSSASSDVDGGRDAKQPLTPPPILSAKKDRNEESLHNLPSFEFEAIGLGGDIKKSEVNPTTTTTMTTVTSPIQSEFGAVTPTKFSSTTTKATGSATTGAQTPSTTIPVRQRISRELIRETVAQRLAEGSLRSKNSSSNLLSTTSTTDSAGTNGSTLLDRPTSLITPRSTSMTGATPTPRPASALEVRQRTPSKAEMNKALPPPPPHESTKDNGPITPSSKESSSIAMSKAATTDGAIRTRTTSGSNVMPSQEGMRKRSYTQSQPPPVTHDQKRSVSGSSQTVKSASAAIQQITKDGGQGAFESPKSALDRLVNAFSSSAEGNNSATQTGNGTSGEQGQRVRIMESPMGQNRKETPIKNRSSHQSEVHSPISILQKPKGQPQTQGQGLQQQLLPPAFVGSGGMAEREAAINARRKNNHSNLKAPGAPTSNTARGHRRRSMSTGDAELDEQTKKRQPRLTLGLDDDDERSILDSFREEVDHLQDRERGYRIREKPVVKACYTGHASGGGGTGADKVSAHAKAGDIDSGRAWRALRRPSDMNEHAAEIRAMRARNVSAGKATGTIFVKVLGIESLALPVPQQPTMFCITLDNGIDYIRTPYVQLVDGAKINQEFALVEHPNFEFSLSLDIRRDPHILKAIHHKLNPPPQPKITTSKPTSGFRALFSSPRKSKRDQRAGTPTAPEPLTPTRRRTSGGSTKSTVGGNSETIAHYITSTGSSTVGKTHVAFRPIAKQCDAKVLEIRYPMFAMFKGEPGSQTSTSVAGPKQRVPSTSNPSSASTRKQVAKITLQIFRLPPLPGLGPDDLPGSIDECLRGIRHHAWHEYVYHEGTLTQHGGDCKHPKRRMFRLVGGNLVAINEVTKKRVTSIDLKKAIAVSDLNLNKSLESGGVGDRSGTPISKKTTASVRSPGGIGDDDGVYGFSTAPRSFSIEFTDGEAIVFAADKEEDKAVWMDTLSGLIGKIPSNPLWAELLAERQKQRIANRVDRSVSASTSSNWSLAA